MGLGGAERGAVAIIDDQIRALIGVWSETVLACDPVEQGAVRRFAQAIMDDDPDYMQGGPAQSRHGGPVAPPLFPNHRVRRHFGAPDLLQERAHDPDFDGVVPAPGLPAIAKLAHLPVLNAGSEFEFYRWARHGETVGVRQCYADIREKSSAKGAFVLIVIESEISTSAGELLLRARRTLMRRVA